MLERFKRSSTRRTPNAGPARWPRRTGPARHRRRRSGARRGPRDPPRERTRRDRRADDRTVAGDRDGRTTAARGPTTAPSRKTAPGQTTARSPATAPRGRSRAPATASRRRPRSRRARARQRDEFGGINWGASFFGWLVAVGVAVLLTALLAAAGAAIGLTATTESEATSNAEEIGLGGGIALVVVLMLAYYAGGYVAGRMSRFDGGRQGLGTWAIGLVVTIALAVAAVVLGDQYNVLEQLNLPSLPVGDQTLATGGIIALAAIVLGSLLAAMFGGKVGERYHKRVDRAGFVD